MRQISKRTWSRGLGCVATVAVAAVGIGLAWPKQRMLLERARPITTIRNPDDWEDQWDWLSDGRILVLSTDQNADKRLGWKGQVYEIDSVTGAKTALPGLTSLLSRDHLSPSGTPYSFALSPDHSWLVWLNDTETIGLDYAAAHLDGTRYHTWKNDANQCDTFFLDDSHWVYRNVYHADKLTIRDLQDPQRDRTYAVTDPAAKEALARHAAQIPAFVDVEQSGDVSDDQFVIHTYRTEDTIQAMYYDCCNTNNPPVSLQQHRIKLPKGATVEDKGVDTGNHFVYYHLQIVSSSPFLAWLHRNLPRFAVPTTETESLWMSRADGQDFHEIGRLPARRIDSTGEDELGGIEWAPGGKQLSFTYKDTLYLVPIDPKN